MFIFASHMIEGFLNFLPIESVLTYVTLRRIYIQPIKIYNISTCVLSQDRQTIRLWHVSLDPLSVYPYICLCIHIKTYYESLHY